MQVLKVGGEVDSQCSSCKMVLAHTILAIADQTIARVRCNTCMREHAFKPAPGSPLGAKAERARATKAKTTAGRTTKVSAARAVIANKSIDFDALLATKGATQSTQYAITAKFKVDEVVNHPSFGLGIVIATRLDKADIQFRGGLKTLLHAKPAPKAPAPAAGPSEG